MAHHRTTLKQQNKHHKTGRHRSNRCVGSEQKGKVQVQSSVRRPPAVLGRHQRRQQLRQLRSNKRQQLLKQLSTAAAVQVPAVRGSAADNEELVVAGATAGGASPLAAPPLVVALVAVSSGVCVSDVLRLLVEGSGGGGGSTGASAPLTSPQGVTHIRVTGCKRGVSLVAPPGGQFHATLDACRSADVVVFIVDEGGVDSGGAQLLSAVFALGVSAACTLLVPTAPGDGATSNSSGSGGRKAMIRRRKMLSRQLSRWFPGCSSSSSRGSDNCRLHSLRSPADVPSLLHRLANVRHRTPLFRQRRSHVLAERVDFCVDNNNNNNNGGQCEDVGTLRVTGFIRQGLGISANQLVHVCGWGDFQLSHISEPAGGIGGATSAEDLVLSAAHPDHQVALDCENVADQSDISDYDQQSLLTADSDGAMCDDTYGDGDDENSLGCLDEDRCPSPMSDSSMASDDEQDNPDDEDDEDSSQRGDDVAKYDNDLDLDEDQVTLAKIKAAREDEMFPDEVDTPQEVPARVRFAKYRGLASFRTAPWDPRENLPPDYSRCYQLKQSQRIQRDALQHRWKHTVQPGRYVTLHIVGVPVHLYTQYQASCSHHSASGRSHPLLVFALLRHEHRMSLLHCVLKRHLSAAAVPAVAAKSRLVFHVGFRRFANTPIFSQHSNLDKHKMERFFRADSTVVASMYAPITYGPVPVLTMLERGNGHQELLATGSLLSVNPNRIVVKRAVLSGHPFRVNKHSAVIRYMFFNREDILWFKPVELRTKLGRRGNIKEPLGTHGHMKVVFNGQLASQDTVLMTLYKRVFPRWGYDPLVPDPAPLYSSQTPRTSLPSIAEEDEEFFADD